MVKVEGRKAAVERKVGDGLWWVVIGGRERSRRSSRCLARRMVKDLTMNWPPKRRPLT